MAPTEKDLVMKIYLKVHETDCERILAACDADLLGKKFSEKDLQIEVKESFYGGTLTDLEKLEEEITKATIVNLTGKNVVEFAVKKNFVEEQNILKISKVKHAQIAVL